MRYILNFQLPPCMTAEGRMPYEARDPPHAISIFLYSREQKANITDLDDSFLKSDAKVLLLFHIGNTLSKFFWIFSQFHQ